jgi:glucokinase
MINIEKIGIDIGGTFIKAGLVEKDNVKISIKFKTPKKQKEIIDKLFFICDLLKTKKTKFIGIGMPGPFKDIEQGIASKQNNIDLSDVNLKQLFEKKYKIKIKINNDANCFALAEANLGKAKNFNNILGITLGSGVGTGLIINKQIYTGRGNALEYGLSIFDINSLTSVEDFLGKKGIIKASKDYNLKVKEPEELYNLALKKNKNALKFWNDYGNLLGLSISNIIKILDPDIIVIGGNVSNAWEFFNKSMFKTINKMSSLKPCPIYKSQLDNPGVIGASLLSL